MFCWSEAGELKAWQASFGQGSDRMELLGIDQKYPWLSSWSPDGKFLALVVPGKETTSDIHIYQEPERKLVPFPNSRYYEQFPEFSPDGRWLAYSTNETGRHEVYLRSFPDGNRKVIISSQGGSQPCWSPDGRELFYVSAAPAKMMKVDIDPGPNLSVGHPQALFDFTYVTNNPIRGWDLHPDGRRFLLIRVKSLPQAKITHLQLVQNWLTELNRLCPAKYIRLVSISIP